MYSELPTSGLPPKRAILRWAIVRFTKKSPDLVWVVVPYGMKKEVGR